MQPIHRTFLIALVGGMYLSALLLPVAGRASTYTGAEFLRHCFEGFTRARWEHTYGLSQVVGFLAHPAFWLGVGCLAAGRLKAAGMMAGLSTVCILAILPIFHSFVLNHIGFYVWVASGLALWFASLRMGIMEASAAPTFAKVQFDTSFTSGVGFSKYDHR